MPITRAVAQRSLRTLASSAQPRASLAAKRAFSTAQPLRMVVSQARYDAADRRPSQWAKNPIVAYEELKPITQQPSDVSLFFPYRNTHLAIAESVRVVEHPFGGCEGT